MKRTMYYDENGNCQYIWCKGEKDFEIKKCWNMSNKTATILSLVTMILIALMFV